MGLKSDSTISCRTSSFSDCSPDLQEWVSTAIDEAMAQKLHIELNSEDETPKSEATEEKGAIFRLVVSLELVSCFLLSRDAPEELLTDGSEDPIRLYVANKPISAPSIVEDQETQNAATPAFLQLTAAVAYPLGPSVPCLRASPGYFVFMLPDQKYYGIVFPEGYPADALGKFENELSKYCALCAFEDGNIVPVHPQEGDYENNVNVSQLEVEAATPTEPPAGPLFSLARGISTGAEYVTWGIRSTSNFLRGGIESTGNAISSQIYKPDANAQIPAPVAETVGFVKNITPGVVYISGGAAAALASIAGYIGTTVGNLLPTNTKGGTGRFGVRAVGAASVKAAYDVWTELLGVGQNLIDGTQKASVQVVKSRYGENAGKLTSDIIGIGSDVYKVNKNIHSFGIRALAKGSVKAAGTALVKSHTEHKNQIANSSKTGLVSASSPKSIASPSHRASITGTEESPSGLDKNLTIPAKPTPLQIHNEPHETKK